jgi:hypothetical protein
MFFSVPAGASNSGILGMGENLGQLEAIDKKNTAITHFDTKPENYSSGVNHYNAQYER